MMCKAQRPRRHGIDGNQVRLDVGVGVPRMKQPIGLNRLSTENAERRSDERDPKWSHTHQPLISIHGRVQ